MRRRLSGFRTAWLASALLTAACLGLVVSLMWRHEAALRPEAVSKLAAIGRSIADQVGLAVEYGIPLEAIKGMDDFLKTMAAPNKEIVYVAITDAAGARLYLYGNAGSAAFAAAPGAMTVTAAGAIDVALPILANHAVTGAIHLGMEESHPIALLYVLGLAATMAGATVLTFVLVLTFNRRHIDRPLGRIRDALTAAAAGRSPAPTDASARGEMAAMVAATDDLLAELESRRHAFQQDMRELSLAQAKREQRDAIDLLAREGEDAA